jgi:hypothetical protein
MTEPRTAANTLGNIVSARYLTPGKPSPSKLALYFSKTPGCYFVKH